MPTHTRSSTGPCSEQPTQQIMPCPRKPILDELYFPNPYKTPCQKQKIMGIELDSGSKPVRRVLPSGLIVHLYMHAFRFPEFIIPHSLTV